MPPLASEAPGALDGKLLAALRELLGERCSTSVSDRDQHGRDESHHPPRPPDAVCYPQSTAEVSAIVRLCAEHATPVIAYGTGSSLEGHVLAVRGGVSVDLSRMDAILAVNADDLDVTVQAGVRRKQLNHHLRDTGLFFPLDPGADATLGGMAATRASGTNAVRYGTMRENVLALEVVLPDGRVIRTASRAKKSSAGYDLTRLFVGSEGTLGIITEVTLRLYGIPEAVSAAVCAFADVAGAVRTAVEAIQLGIPVARVELLDGNAIAAVNAYSKLAYPVGPTLFLEFHGTPRAIEEQALQVAALCEANGGGTFAWATAAEERTRLWQARHDMHYALLATRPGARSWGTDVCVPISRLPECIARTNEDTAAAPFFTALLGHVGDGNFHLAMVVDPKDPAELAEAGRINDRLVRRALEFGGTCTGEHGVGLGKTKFLEAEHGGAVDVMRAVKHALDPQGIMNPGKVLPGEAAP